MDELVCFMHSSTAADAQYADYQLQSGNIQWIDIGRKVSVPKRMLNSRRFTRPLRERHRQMDALLIRGPSPLLPAMAKAAGPTAVALLLVGDYLAGVNDLPQPRWRKEAIRLWMNWNTRQQMAVAKRSLTFVNSHLLFEQLQSIVPDLVETRTTTLSAQDFFERDDTCQSRPIRLLYTGRLDRAKGLFEMVDALECLTRDGHDVVLDLVGWPAKGDTIVVEIQEEAQRRGIQDRVCFHGYKSVGPELFAYYKRADIYLIASRSSEGFPRTIWEAMAHSLPVVTTEVGSIGHFLTHGQHAWLVEHASGPAVAQGIQRLINDGLLRRQLIRSGRELARTNTLESRANELVRKLEAWMAT